jgi:4-amino-4-deoxy-L-arabinose transferase-like glycosyltransferase
MLRQRHFTSPSPSIITAVLFLFSFFWNAVFAFVTPPFEGPDERQHYCYAVLIAQTGALPPLIEPHPEYQVGHPPLYYLIAAPWLIDLHPTCYKPPANPFADFTYATPVYDNRNVNLLTRADRSLPDVIGLQRLRWLSVALGALTVSVTFWTARLVFGDDLRLAASTAIWVASLPAFSWISGLFNNDNLAILMGALITYGSARCVMQGAGWRSALGLGVVTGLAVISKLNLILFAPVVMIALVMSPARPLRPRRWPMRLSLAGLALFSMIITGMWWFIRNSQLGPELAGLGQLRLLGPIRWSSPPTPETLISLTLNQWQGFWGWYGYQVRMPIPVLQVGSAMLIASAAGLVLGWKRGLLAGKERLVVFLLLVTAVSFAGGVYAVWLSHDGGQGRFLLPGITSTACLVTLGWTQLVPAPVRRWSSFLIMFGAVLYATVGFVTLYWPAYRPPRLWSPNDQPPFDTPIQVTYSDVVELLGASVHPTRIRPGEEVTVTLCFRPLHPANSVVITVKVFDVRSSLVKDRTTYPGLGRYLSEDWISGYAFCDPITILVPGHVEAPARYTIEAMLSGPTTLGGTPAAVGPIGQVILDGPPVTLPPDLQPISATLEHDLQMLGYRLSSDAFTAGQTASLTLYWKANSVAPENYHVFVHLLNSSGALVAQYDGEPRQGAYPTASWQAGEIVADVIQLNLGPQVLPGPVRLAIGMYQWPTLTRLKMSGENVQNDSLWVEGLLIR